MNKTILSIAFLTLISSTVYAKDVIKLPQGSITVNEDNAFFKSNQGIVSKIKIEEDSASFGVSHKFKNDGQDVLLFSQSSGGTACPATYFFFTVDTNGNPQQSPTFGTCSDLIKVKQEGKKLIVTMPNMGTKGSSKYVFDNKVLTENGKVIK